MARRRRVVRSPQFVRQAAELYPPEGSAEGRARFHMFESGPLAAAEEVFSRAFDTLLADVDGTGIRIATTIPTRFFPPMVFYGRLTAADEVELLYVEPDEEYWDLIGDDPSD